MALFAATPLYRGTEYQTQNVRWPANQPRTTGTRLSIFDLLSSFSLRSLNRYGRQHRLIGGSCSLKIGRRITHLRNNLRAPETCGPSFLPEPAACCTKRAGWKRVDHRGQNLNDSCDEAAIGTVEVPAFSSLAGRGESKNFSGLDGAGDGEQIVCDGKHLVHISDLWTRLGRLPDTEYDRALHLRLRARAGVLNGFSWGGHGVLRS